MLRVRNWFIILASLTVFLIVFNAKSLSNDFLEYNDVIKSNLLESKAEFTTSQSHRYVTPSLAELGVHGVPPVINKHVLMLTRIPGAGSEVLVLLLQRLQGYNAFKHIRLPPGDGDLLTSLQQELLIEEITGIIRQEAIPLSFDGNVKFLNFSQFGRQAPAFISAVRDPRDVQALHRYKKEGASTIYKGAISYFCGQESRCTKRNSRWPLERAKENVEKWYPIVGVLEHIEETLDRLESVFPYFFHGAKSMYKKILSKHNKKIDYPVLSSKSSVKRFDGALIDEMEFYLWIKSRLLNGTSGNM